MTHATFRPSVFEISRDAASPLGPALVASCAGALAMSLGLPKTNVALLVPLGAVAVFWAFFRSSPRRAFWLGWLSGTLYFCVTFRWFGEFAGALVAPFGFGLVLAPALLEGLAFAVAGALSAFAVRRAAPVLVPLSAAAAFALCEFVRASGRFGLPFGNLAYSQVESPLAPLAAFVGPFGLTFALCIPASYAAYALAFPERRGARGAFALSCATVLVATAFAWIAWPARVMPKPTFPVAAIQGNIPQSIKWTQSALNITVARYLDLTREAGRSHPKLILWPETVMPLDLNEFPELERQIGAVARETRAEVVAGAKEQLPAGEYNALFYFRPDGTIDDVYRKQRMVPFVEQLPAPGLLGWIPGADLVSRFRSGRSSVVVPVGAMRFAALICWESAFDDLAHTAVGAGAQALLVATDDAWFGTTAGPYQHAQIAQMRALETGSWIVRAAATGISGIIAPNGRYVQRSALQRIAIVSGAIGPPAPALYARLGAYPIVVLLIVACALPLWRRRWSA